MVDPIIIEWKRDYHDDPKSEDNRYEDQTSGGDHSGDEKPEGENNMRIMIMGAGAVGGYFGSRFQLAGQDVCYIVRGDHLKAMNEKGLRIEGVSGNTILQVKASQDPSDFGIMDLVVITVKSQDTPQAIDMIEPNVGKDTTILCLQNGVENEERIIERYGIERTLGGVAYIRVGVEAPGLIVNQTSGRIAIGRFQEGGPDSQRVEEIKHMIEQAGISISVTDNIMLRKWGKLVWNAMFNPVSVLTGHSSYHLKEDPSIRGLFEGIITEVVQVAEREGYHLDKEKIFAKMFDLSRAVRGTKTSMLQDYEKGKPLEIDALNGAVIRKGEEHGIPVPINISIVGMIRGKVEQRAEP